MSSPPSSPTKIRPGSRDTGFPKPFCGNRNTTLPHPDADLSPNATISQDDLELSTSLKRSRRSFLAKHRRTISHGYISPQAEAAFGSLMVMHHHQHHHPQQQQQHPPSVSEEVAHDDNDDDKARAMKRTATVGGSSTTTTAPSVSTDGRPSKDGSESLSSAGDAASERRRHRGLLRRLGLRK